MNWITNFVRPRIKGLMGSKTSSTDNLWRKCNGCGERVSHRDLTAAKNVSPHWGHPTRSGAKGLFAALSGGAHERRTAPDGPQDPVKSRDDKRSPDGLKEYRHKTSQTDAL